MPVGGAARRKQSHRERRRIDDAYAALLEVVEIVGEHIVVQTVVAEAKNALHGAFR